MLLSSLGTDYTDLHRFFPYPSYPMPLFILFYFGHGLTRLSFREALLSFRAASRVFLLKAV